MSDTERPLPLDDWHRGLGARMVPFAGYAMPIQYEGIMAEHRWTRECAGLFDVSHMGQLLIAGPEARDAGWRPCCPPTSPSLKDGRPKYSLLLTDDGGIIDDLMVTRRGDHFYMVVNGATKEGDIAHLRARLPRGVVLDHMKEQALLALQGPKAVDALARLVPGVADADLHDRRRRSDSTGSGPGSAGRAIPARTASRFRCRPMRSRRSPTCCCDQPEVKPIGLGARDSLRLEAGLPLYGHDLDTHDDAGRGRTSSSRCRSAAARRAASRAGRASRRSWPMGRSASASASRSKAASRCARARWCVDGEGNEVGKVTSGGFSPSLEAPIAMAYVPLASAAPGSARLAGAARQDLQPAGRRRCPSSPIATTAREPAMMSVYYTKDHEWIRVDGDTATVGITDYRRRGSSATSSSSRCPRPAATSPRAARRRWSNWSRPRPTSIRRSRGDGDRGQSGAGRRPRAGQHAIPRARAGSSS